MIGTGRVAEALRAVRQMWPRPADGLPPGQGLVGSFPRFGIHLADPVPAVPPQPSVEVCGAGVTPFHLPLADLQAMPRRTLVADFHCVAGWSVRGLRWEGVPFRTLWEDAVLPRAQPQEPITHLSFVGLDRYRSVLTVEDALADDVLVADRLDGAPLTGAHGAPARLVTPRQYGYMNTKHLARIELHTREPAAPRHPSRARRLLLAPVAPHPRARVDQEERHRHLPAWSIRFLYRRVILPVLVTVMDRESR